ncbi:MAG TPA: sialidase family protein [Candidatus Thermoplasmatota archaeon]|nr:sialidase family protein [Candidatus Thermoplasmatota archaeon]
MADRSVWALALLLSAPALAGCLSSPVEQAATSAELPSASPAYVVTDATGALVTPPSDSPLADPIRLVERLLGQRGGEPNIGATSSGAVFVTAGHATMRSTDLGATWEEVFNLSAALPQLPPQAGPARVTRSSDPMLWVDPITDRVFTDHMSGLYCSNLFWSDDDGAKWTMRPWACGIPVNDHQKVATGAYGPMLAKPPNPVYDTVVYYCYNKLVSTQCAVSYDGGLSFPVDRTVAVGFLDGCGGINGHPAAAPDGTVYVPMNEGCDAPYVGVSQDNGLSWEVRKGPDDHGAEEIDPDVTVTPDGTAYYVWRGSDHLQYLARSKDRFETWEGPWRVSPPHVTSTVFTGITSGDDGKIALAFLGTDDTDEYAQEAPPETRWHLYVTYSLDAASEAPTFATTQVTPEEDPVQVGCVWLAGGSGGERECRNMLDFIDVTSDREGRVYVAFTDGCTLECAGYLEVDEMNSRRRDGAVAAIADGPLLVGGGWVSQTPG